MCLFKQMLSRLRIGRKPGMVHGSPLVSDKEPEGQRLGEFPRGTQLGINVPELQARLYPQVSLQGTAFQMPLPRNPSAIFLCAIIFSSVESEQYVPPTSQGCCEN